MKEKTPHDPCSNFRSSIEWPDMGPDRSCEPHKFATLGGDVGVFVKLAENARKIEPICESPIETILGSRLAVFRDRWDALGLPKFKLVAQHKLGRFRYDFAILSESGKLLIAIECDGKEFHSTPEQLANDKAKNEAVLAANAEIFRFTGSNIFLRDRDCARAVFELLREKMGISRETPDPPP